MNKEQLTNSRGTKITAKDLNKTDKLTDGLGTDTSKEDLAEALTKKFEKEPVKLQLAPVIQECMLKTKHGRIINCRYWVHTDKYFQYYEKGYELVDAGDGKYLITGDTVIVPEHEIQFVIIRKAQSAIPKEMFIALGGKTKLIQVVGNDKNCDSA